MGTIIKFMKDLFCWHDWQRDRSLPLQESPFFFIDGIYVETLTPMICMKCGKKGVDSDVL